MISVIQPNNQVKIPSGESPTPTASSDLSKVSKQDVSQEIEQKKADLNQLKSQEARGQINAVELDGMMNDLNAQLQKLQNYLKFERDQGSDRMVVFIKNSETNELIRQIPTQEFLAISKNIGQYLEMRQQLSEKIPPPVGMLANETV